MVSKLASVPSCPGFNFQHSQKILSGQKLSMLLRLISLEESGQWLEKVDRTHLALSSGRLVLQKNFSQ